MPATADIAGRLGAYGLCLPDLRDAAELLCVAPEIWGEWHIAHRHGQGNPTEFVEADRARLCSEPDGWVELSRANRTSTFNLPVQPNDRALIHPYMASTASVAARWEGLQSFHAGAFLLEGRAWGVLGAKGAGKSSILAHLSLQGVPILTDDVLVLRGTTALAGPRCVDLRTESAQHLEIGEPLGVVGTRERWRLMTGASEPEASLAGWICLSWGASEWERMNMDERLAILFASLSLRIEPRDPDALMELLALPMFKLTRPRRLDALGETGTRLLDGLGGLMAARG